MSWKTVIEEFSNVVILLLLLICVVGGVLYATGNIVYINQETKDDYDILREISQRYADTHTYVNGSFNCQNYSNDFAYILQNLGFETYVYWNMQEHHAYNLIAIEPQTGRLKTINISKK